jgi:hypothetical protein
MGGWNPQQLTTFMRFYIVVDYLTNMIFGTLQDTIHYPYLVWESSLWGQLSHSIIELTAWAKAWALKFTEAGQCIFSREGFSG